MRVLNFGSLNIDNVYKVDHIAAKGETLSSESLRHFSGGKGLNQSIALSRAGVPVWHAGCIGTDGRFLLEELQASGVHTEYISVLEDIPTGHAVIQNSRDGDNCILLFGGSNQAVTGEQADRVLNDFSAGDILVLQNEISELPYIMRRAYEKGMVIALNPSPMNEKVYGLPLDYVNIILLNEVEAAQILHEEPASEERLIRRLPDVFPGAEIILTLGSQGSVYLHKNDVIRQKAYPVNAVDTTAAGDTFTGYYLAGMIKGYSPAKSLDLAARAAAIAVTREGASPSIPLLEEVLKNHFGK